MATYLVMRLGYLLCGIIPQRVMYLFAQVLAAILFVVAPTRRRIVETNLRQVLGPQVSSAELARQSRIVFAQSARNYVDILTLGHQSEQALAKRIAIDGWQNLESALAAGKGVVLISPHIGNMDVVVQYMALRGHPITVPVQRVQPERLFHFLCQLRGGRGVRLIPVGEEAMRELMAALRRGEAVGLVADRDIQGTGASVPFFGRATLLPSAPALLALRSGAPLMLAHAVRQPNGKVLGRIGPPVYVQRTAAGGMQAAISSAMVMVASLLEQPIREHPEQWVVFEPIWKEAAG